MTTSKKVIFILIMILILLISIFGITYFLIPKNDGKNEWLKISYAKKEYIKRYHDYQLKNNSLSKEEIVTYVNIGLDQPFYTNISLSNLVDGNLLIVNKYHYLEEDYVPETLEILDSRYTTKEVKLKKEAKDAFIKLIEEAQKEGYTIKGYSGYRSYDYQKRIYNNYSKLDGVEKADTYSARAGFSEHQTGLAIDVNNGVKSYTEFGNTKEFTWMKENAYRFGFILRYTKETEWITGYQDEPWHYRYVGIKVANYLHNHPMTYEEYYVKFIAK